MPPAPRPMLPGPRTLVIGLGNPILGDDGAGWHAAEAVRPHVGPGVVVECHAGGGLSLMERLIGCDRAIVIDALQLNQAAAGTVCVIDLEALAQPGGHLASPHETTLPAALRLGRALGLALPAQVIVVGIEAQPVYEFSEALSPAVAAAVPIAAQRVLQLLEG